MAWLLAKKPWISPIPGTTKLHRLHENLLSVHLNLNPNEIEEIENASAKIQIQGARYSEAAMKMVGK